MIVKQARAETAVLIGWLRLRGLVEITLFKELYEILLIKKT